VPAAAEAVKGILDGGSWISDLTNRGGAVHHGPWISFFRSLWALGGFVVACVPNAHGLAVEPSANLLPNPSFEEKADDSVRGWSSRAWHGKEDCRWSVESPGRTGGNCVSIASKEGADAAWTATVAVEPNAFYRLSGWIKTEDVQGAVGALLNIQNMQHVRTPRSSGTKDWTRVTTAFRTGTETRLEINCLFGGWGKSTGRAWYDDVVLERIEAPAENTEALVVIHADAASTRYSPMIFGGFLEHFGRQVYGGVFDPGSPLADEDGFREDVIDALKELKVPVIRWPGGCFVDAYHWRKGVGEKREPYGDPRWGVIEPNTFGTHEFVELCRRVGAEPYICFNGLASPRENLDWVAYCNATEGEFAELRRHNGHPEPFNVKFWSVGNERYDKAYIERVRDTASAMKALYPNVLVTCSGSQGGTRATGGAVHPYLLETAGEHLDYISVHNYWLARANTLPRYDYLTAVTKSEWPDAYMTLVSESLHDAGQGRIKIAFDEWNLRAWQHPGFPRNTVKDFRDPEVRMLVEQRVRENDLAEQYTMADALFAASFLNACLRHAEDVTMANIAPLVNTRGPLFVHPEGIVKRTHFHALAMYANLLQSRVGKADVTAGALSRGRSSVAVVDAVATVDDSGGTWSIALVNRHPSKIVACTVKMEGVPIDGRHEATVLGGESPDSYNDVENPNRVTPRKTQLDFKDGTVSLPPHSLTIVSLTAKGL
jgi:alpha-N-arabinofuranosidase